MLRSIGSTPRALDDTTLSSLFSASASAYAAAEYRATVTSQLPLVVLNKKTKDQLEESPLDHILSQSSQLLNVCTLSLLIWGRVYLRKRYNAAGYPTGLEFLHPANVRENYLRGNIVRDYHVRTDDWSYDTVPVDQIVYAQAFDPNPDGRGLSKFEVALKHVSADYGMVIYQSAFFVNGAQIAGIVRLPAESSDEQFEAARNAWQMFKGAKNQFSTAVLPAGVEYTPIGSVPRDLMMGELKDGTRLDIYQIMQVDPSLTGASATSDALSANSTYSSKEVAHIRGVSLPFVNSTLIAALNEQWAWTDFDRHDHYTLTVDEASIPALAEAQLTKAQTAQGMTSANIIDYNEARAMVGQEDRDGYLTRAAAETIAVYSAGFATMNESRRLIGLPPLAIERDMVFVQGVLVPVDQLNVLADANVEQIKMLTTPFPAPPDAPVSPIGDTLLLSEPERDDDDGVDTSMCVALALRKHPDLIGIQQQARAEMVRQGIPTRWLDPEEFHVTLTSAPQCDDLGRLLLAIAAIPVPVLSLSLTSVKTFASATGEYPLHLRVVRTTALMDYQRAVYDACLMAGVRMSSYSDPLQWTPHITLGYTSAKPAERRYSPGLRLKPDGVLVWYGDGETVYEASSEDAPTVVPSPELPALRSYRADAPVSIELMASLAGNQFVIAARNELASWLADKGVGAEWVDDSAYGVMLVQATCTPSLASDMLQSINVENWQRIGMWSDGYLQAGDAIYLLVNNSDSLQTSTSGLLMQLDDLAIAPAVHGVLIARMTPELDLSQAPHVSRPLVAPVIALSVNGVVKHEWELRTPSLEQRREMDNWEKVAKRSLERGQGFKSEVLPMLVRTFIALSLEEPDADLADIFTAARFLLTESIRAFASTRANFINALRPIFEAAMAGQSSRQQFTGGMRTQLRVFGLIAFRDGMNEVGYDPEGFSPEEISLFRQWQAQQSLYLTGIGDEMFKERKVNGDAEKARPLTPAQIEQRIGYWADISLENARELGVLAANAKQKMTWGYNPEAVHCKTCLFLNGKTYTIEEWIESGITPGSGRTDCKSGCKCVLRVAPTGTKLSPRRLIGLSNTRRSVDDHFDERDELPDDPHEQAIEFHACSDDCQHEGEVIA